MSVIDILVERHPSAKRKSLHSAETVSKRPVCPVFRGNHLHCHLPPCLGLSLATAPLGRDVEGNEADSAVL